MASQVEGFSSRRQWILGFGLYTTEKVTIGHSLKLESPLPSFRHQSGTDTVAVASISTSSSGAIRAETSTSVHAGRMFAKNSRCARHRPSNSRLNGYGFS